jgi:3-oxoacyl-[acyl-carrier protein] reductase
MELKIKDKTALVTGASSGIGRACAKGLAAEGVKLCIAARRRELLAQLGDEIVAAGGQSPHIVVVDVMDESAPQRLAQAALEHLGHIDILVNSAGAAKPLPNGTPEEKWIASMTLNFTRVRQLTEALLPGMIERKWGRVISITGKSEQPYMSPAHSAKAGLHIWSHGMSKEIARHGVTLNCIAPGRIMSDQIRRNYSEEERARQSKHDIPVGRFGEPEELAHLVVFLASPLAGYITGTVMPVDGGMRQYAF